MKTYMLLGFLVLVTACQHIAASSDSGLSGLDGNLIENQTQACLAKGGRFGQGAQEGTFVCYQDTKDANQSCSASTDCEGQCLARSRTCTPVTPLFGCNEVLGRLGARTMLCLQ